MAEPLGLKAAIASTSTDVVAAKREEVEKVIEVWRAQRDHRLELNRLMEKAKSEETQLKSWLLEVFKQQKFEGMLIGGRITGLAEGEIATVEDKEAFMAYILKEQALELLQFRLSTTAVDERRDNGVQVPGTRYVTTYELFDRKLK